VSGRKQFCALRYGLISVAITEQFNNFPDAK
jgi:hypothetical protein